MSSRPFQLWLFTVRLWQETVDNGQLEWRGEVKNTTSGETRYFRDWHTLADLLPLMLEEEAAHSDDELHSTST